MTKQVTGMRLSRMMEQFTPNILQELEQSRLAMIADGREVINLSTGTPDLPPDSRVLEIMSENALYPQNYMYSLRDLPELQNAVIGWYKTRYGVLLERNEIHAVYGSQEGIAHVAFAFCNPGDIVLAGTPGYPIFSFGPLLAGARLCPIPLLPENGFLFDFDAIPSETARKARLIIVSYPNNPLASVAGGDFYERLVAFAKKYDILVVHDNAYSEYVFDGEPGGSFLSFPGAMDVGIEFNSLSKSHNLSGLRVSFALGNRDMIEAFRTLRSQIDYGLSLLDQKAAVAALTNPPQVVLRNREIYRARRDILCDGLCEAGWNVQKPAGTMFCWFPVPEGWGSEAFCKALLQNAGVIAVPGNTFGQGGEGWVRFALVAPESVMLRAAQKIKASGLIKG